MAQLEVSEDLIRRRGRPPKFEPATARRLLVDEGLRELRERGLSVGVEQMSLERAIRASGVPRGAAYRVWGAEDALPQHQFRTAVLLEFFAGRGPGAVFDALDETADDVLDDPTDRSSVETLKELMHRIADVLRRDYESTEQVRLARLLTVAVREEDRIDSTVYDSIDQLEHEAQARVTGVIGGALDRLDLSVSEPFSIEHLVALARAIVAGVSHRPRGDTTDAAGESTDPDMLIAVGVDALVDRLVVGPATARTSS